MEGFIKQGNDVLRCGCLGDPQSCMWRVDGRDARMGAGRQAGVGHSHPSDR